MSYTDQDFEQTAAVDNPAKPPLTPLEAELLAALQTVSYDAWQYDADAEEEDGNWSVSHKTMEVVDSAIAKATGRGA